MGSYFLKIRQSRPEAAGAEVIVNDYLRALTLSYKPEYRHLGVNESLLQELAITTGGQYQPRPEQFVRRQPGETVAVRQRLWPWLLAAAVLLFVADVALRRLDLAGYRVFHHEAQRYG
jgi:hypothetical protein